MGGSFQHRFRRARWVVLAVALVVVGAGVQSAPVRAEDPLDPVLGDPGTTYPDLVPDAHEFFPYRPAIGFENETFIFGPPVLAFDTWSQNLGSVALDLMPEDPVDFETSTVSQCVSWRAPGVCRERRTVGGFTWHEEHRHFHYEDFASYQLRRLTADGSVDYTATGLVSASDKVSFCLLDSTQVRPDAPPAPTYLTCTPTRQGISPGYADIYTSDLEGQQVSLEGLVDGRYALVVTLDYADTINESDNTNNRVEIILDLTGLEGEFPQAQLVERRWPTLQEDEDCRDKGTKKDKRHSNAGKGRGKVKC